VKDAIKSYFEGGLKIRRRIAEELVGPVESAVRVILSALRAGGKVLIFGNGGSAADAQHMAAELAGRFEKERTALSAVALTTDTSVLTAVANDYSFAMVFERQVSALGRKGDIAFGISTSGRSENVLRALEAAKKLGLKTIALTGKDGGPMAEIADVAMVIPSDRTAYIQEGHGAVIHAICEQIDQSYS